MAKEADYAKQTRERIPNKTQWALQDILKLTDDAHKHWEELQEHAEETTDIVVATKAGRFRDAIARIREKAADALQGKYNS